MAQVLFALIGYADDSRSDTLQLNQSRNEAGPYTIPKDKTFLSNRNIINESPVTEVRLTVHSYYQTFGKAIRSTVDYIKQAVNADNELSRSVNILRGNILTAFQQIYTFLRPIIMAIIGLLNLLTGIFNKFMSLLTGKSVKSSQAAAKSQLGG